jgi:hypothetical protein
MKVTTFKAVSRLQKLSVLGLVAAVFMLMSVPAFAATQIDLHDPHVGADSTMFQVEGDDGGLTDPVVWHFVLNQLDPGAPAGTLYVTFQSAGEKTAIGIPVGNGSVQHYYVGTPDHDIIVSAYVLVESEGGMLVLSHIALNEPPGEEPPGEEPPGEEPPGEEPPGEEPPGLTEEPSLPFTEEEPFLPFTGGPGIILLGAAAAATAGAALRKISR